jgi:hypothetical protein
MPFLKTIKLFYEDRPSRSRSSVNGLMDGDRPVLCRKADPVHHGQMIQIVDHEVDVFAGG